MSLSATTPKVFIIESLDLEDEQNDRYEGQIISNILKFADIEHQYHYVRTKIELEHFVREFARSGYRYLHISCHGNRQSISTTLESVTLEDLSLILETSLDKKRLFMSACSVVNRTLADKLFGVTDCYSVIGPCKTINMDDAAIFWASFYHLMFKKNKKAMKRDVLEPTVLGLVKLYDVQMKYYTSSRKTEEGWKEVILK